MNKKYDKAEIGVLQPGNHPYKWTNPWTCRPGQAIKAPGVFQGLRTLNAGGTQENERRDKPSRWRFDDTHFH
jgi:hypothetical protein